MNGYIYIYYCVRSEQTDLSKKKKKTLAQIQNVYNYIQSKCVRLAFGVFAVRAFASLKVIQTLFFFC